MKKLIDRINSSPLGVKFFIYSYVIFFLGKITNLASCLANKLLLFGLYDPNLKVPLETALFKRDSITSAVLMGKLLAAVLFIYFLKQFIAYKSWTRKILIITSIFALCVYLISIKNFSVLYIQLGTNYIWTGYYLWLLFSGIVCVYLLFIVFYFSQKRIKYLFIN